MEDSRGVPIMITLPRKYRDLLRKMAGEKNIVTPSEVTTASRLGREIICKYLDEVFLEMSEPISIGSNSTPSPKSEE